MEDQALYQLALARINGIGPAYTRKLIEHFGDAMTVFRADRSALEHTGLPCNVIDSILNFSDYRDVQTELVHLRKLQARILFFTDPGYPRRLQHLSGAPTLLFYQGAVDLNAEKIVAIVGTRSPTEYGKAMTAKLVHELDCPGLLILSGLAFGIDAVAHHTALRHHLPTVGVLGHGLDHLYPAEHRSLFHQMRRQGGLLTSFFHETGPESHTFPVRNQLVAGLCDALVVVESGTRGGSLSAVKAARGFGKKVFALPGRVIDPKSQGCLQLIQKGEALPLLSAEQLKAAMGWQWTPSHASHQPALPFSSATSIPSPESPGRVKPAALRTPQRQASVVHEPISPGKAGSLESKLINLLTAKQPRTLEEFITLTRQPVPKISVTLLHLELNGIIRSLAGKRYLLV